MSKPNQYTVDELKAMPTDDLVEIMKGYGYDASVWARHTLITSIVNEQNKRYGKNSDHNSAPFPGAAHAS